MNPYEKCPVFENESYLLRLVTAEDAADLLKVYSDERAVPFFNSDNCHGDDFHYTTPERMQRAVEFWQYSYENGYFVRWAVVEKRENRAVGTIELFRREVHPENEKRAKWDYFDGSGILRLDLRSDFERTEKIREILSLILPEAFALFGCDMIATKIHPENAERKKAAERLGFLLTQEKLIGEAGEPYGDYYVLKM